MFQSHEFTRFDRPDEQMRLTQLVYFYMDLSAMEKRAQEKKYKSLEHFLGDLKIIMHNVFLMYGGKFEYEYCLTFVS